MINLRKKGTKMAELNWLSRDIGPKGPYLRLCTSEKQFKEVLKYFKLSSGIPWLGKPSADAVTHTFENGADHHTCVVCINIDLHKRTGVEIAGLLVRL